MATHTNWINVNNNYNDYYRNRYTQLAILNSNEINSLANKIMNPDFITSIFKDIDKYLKGLTYYPINLTKIVDNKIDETFPNLTLGGVSMGGIPYRRPNLSQTLFFLGSKYIEPYYNSFADYNGYTRIELHLPYYGSIELSPNDVMGKSIGVNLKIDLISGQGIYYICVKDGVHNSSDNIIGLNSRFVGRILSTHIFQIGTNIPISSTNNAEIQRNLLLGAVKMGGSIIGSALNSQSSSVSSVTSFKNSNRKVNYKQRNRQGNLTIRKQRTDVSEQLGGSIKEYTSNYGMTNTFNNCFDTAMDSLSNMFVKADTDKVNNSALLCDANMSIKVVIYRPKFISTDTRYNYLYGKPLGEVKYLSSLTGYTEISSIRFYGENFKTITNSERDILEQVVTGGIIL